MLAPVARRDETGAIRARARRSPIADDEQLLVEAADLVARGWCRSALAEDRHGRRVDPWSEKACRWSPHGALTKVGLERGGGALEAFEVAYTSLALATGGRLEQWNAAPWRTSSHVLSAFERARALLPEARHRVRARRRVGRHLEDTGRRAVAG